MSTLTNNARALGLRGKRLIHHANFPVAMEQALYNHSPTLCESCSEQSKDSGKLCT